MLAAAGVDVSPNASGLPGSSSLVSLLGGLQQFDALLAAIAGILIGAAVWALRRTRTTTKAHRAVAPR